MPCRLPASSAVQACCGKGLRLDNHPVLPVLRTYCAFTFLQFDQPVELQLGAETTQSQNAALTVELAGGSWFGGGSVGRIKVPVRDILK